MTAFLLGCWFWSHIYNSSQKFGYFWSKGFCSKVGEIKEPLCVIFSLECVRYTLHTHSKCRLSTRLLSRQICRLGCFRLHFLSVQYLPAWYQLFFCLFMLIWIMFCFRISKNRSSTTLPLFSCWVSRIAPTTFGLAPWSCSFTTPRISSSRYELNRKSRIHGQKQWV